MAGVKKKWVQLVVGNQIPVKYRITVNGTRVVDLRRAVKEQMPALLTHYDAAELQVFLQGATAARLSEPIPTTTSEDDPVIVRAPPREGHLC
jgi:hypothetical protein